MLIKSVVSSIPIYCMSSFLLPHATCKRLYSSLSKFWWGYKKNSTHYLSLQSWSKMCTPKISRRNGVKTYAGNESCSPFKDALAVILFKSSPLGHTSPSKVS